MPNHFTYHTICVWQLCELLKFRQIHTHRHTQAHMHACTHTYTHTHMIHSCPFQRKLNECRRVIIQLPLIESHSNSRIFSSSINNNNINSNKWKQQRGECKKREKVKNTMLSISMISLGIAKRQFAKCVASNWRQYYSTIYYFIFLSE